MQTEACRFGDEVTLNNENKLNRIDTDMAETDTNLKTTLTPQSRELTGNLQTRDFDEGQNLTVN